VATLAGLRFALGHDIADDPQFPWIESTLKNPAIGDPNLRAQRLFAKAQTYLKHAIASLD